MTLHKSTIWLAAILILAGVLALPAAVEAQCSVTGSNTGTYTNAGMLVRYVLKYLNNSYDCSLTMQMNVDDCNANPSATTGTLSAAAFDTATNPSCMWNCTGGCGAVTIDGSDGLPVELMEFEIAESGSDDGFEDEDETDPSD